MENSLNLTPRQIVERLDQYIIAQKDAKKAVAVALRNRYRRSLLDDQMRESSPMRLSSRWKQPNLLK